MSDYTIIFAATFKLFEKLVNEAMSDGYVLVGGVATIPVARGTGFIQAVAKVKL